MVADGDGDMSNTGRRANKHLRYNASSCQATTHQDGLALQKLFCQTGDMRAVHPVMVYLNHKVPHPSYKEIKEIMEKRFVHQNHGILTNPKIRIQQKSGDMRGRKSKYWTKGLLRRKIDDLKRNSLSILCDVWGKVLAMSGPVTYQTC